MSQKCACGCGQYVDASRVIGWDRRYASPKCERAHVEAQADAFAKWWERGTPGHPVTCRRRCCAQPRA